MAKGLEAQTQAAILEYLAVRRIWFMRTNTGAIVSEYKGKSRMIRYGKKGCADILCTFFAGEAAFPVVLWIECKAPKGVQSETQKAFQQEVEAQGHKYLIARSIDDVAEFIDSMTS